MNNNNSVVQFEIDHPISRLVRFERVFQRTSICILIAYVLTSIYYTMNFSYSIYYISKLGCQKIRILYLLNIISDILFWAATAILYLAIKYTSIRRFQKYNYTIYALIIIRLAYAFNLLIMEEGLTEEDATDCKFTSHEKIKKILFYLVENLFYVITVGTVHYLISILTSIPFIVILQFLFIYFIVKNNHYTKIKLHFEFIFNYQSRFQMKRRVIIKLFKCSDDT